MIEPIFATPIYTSDKFYQLTNEQLNYLKNLSTLKQKGNNFISAEKFILDNEAMEDFKNWCLLNVISFSQQLGISEKTSFYITQSWLNKNPPQSYHHTHMHPNSIFSCIYYVEGDECPTSFYRYDDSFGNFNFYEDSNIFTSKKVGVMNEVGRLLIFPSTLVHDVEINNSNKERITISFNTFFEGEMGDLQGSDHLIIK
tara:strand:- start:1762 stop:2358 length:597 start_codon:yes stop_codon:yes gene_type:complete